MSSFAQERLNDDVGVYGQIEDLKQIQAQRVAVSHKVVFSMPCMILRCDMSAESEKRNDGELFGFSRKLLTKY